MDDIRRIASNSLVRATGNIGRQEKAVKWHGLTLYIKPLISCEEQMGLVDNIVQDCMDKDGNFIPSLLPMALRVQIINAYAFVRLPKELGDLHYVVYWSDLYDTVCANVNQAQLEDIKMAVELLCHRG